VTLHHPGRANSFIRAVGLVGLWPATVALFSLYGWLGDEPVAGYKHHGPFYTDPRFESAVGFAAIGSGAAFCIFIGLLLVRAVRRHRSTRPWAALLLVPSAIVAIVIPSLIVSAIMHATQYHGGDYEAAVHLFGGEHAWWLVIAPFCAFKINLCISAVLLICVIRVPKL